MTPSSAPAVWRASTTRAIVLTAALGLAAWMAPAVAHAALVRTVTSGTASLPNSDAPTHVVLTGVDITRAFVLCSTRTANTSADEGVVSCDLNTGGPGGAARLTITPATEPGNTTTRVQYSVVEFEAGVSVQRGIAVFSGTSTTPTAAPTLTAVDCTKSFVLLSQRSTDSSTSRDELWTIRALLATGANPCTTGTTSTLQLTRTVGRNNTTVTVAWQVVEYEGATVQRGTSCIGGSGANPACPTASGATNGLTNRVTLGTAVDTSKSFVLLTRRAGTSTDGVEGEYNVRGEFLTGGTAVTGVQFARSATETGNNRHVDIAYEVVSLADGSTVQRGTTSLTGAATSTTATLTAVDTTRTAVVFTVSGGDSDSANRLDDTSLTGTLNGANGSGGSSLTFTRLGTSDVGTVSAAWFAVSFFRCNTASGVAADTLCTLAASAVGTTATVNWASVNPVLILGGTAPITVTPTHGVSYTAGQTIGGVPVFYSGTDASDTAASAGGLTVGTTYYYKIWAKAGPVGSCTSAPCYIGGAQGTVTPRAGATAWTAITVGGAALNPAVAGIATPTLSFGSNAGKLLTVSSATGAWASVPANTLGAVQGYVSVFPFGAGDALIAADQSGWVSSIDTTTGGVNWVRKLGADAVQAAASVYLRTGFTAAMHTAYPGTYDIVFAATMNNTATGGFTNNKVFALRSDTGAILWTFNPLALRVAPCPSGCPMDQVLGQPWVDYERARLYVISRDGSAGTQHGIWVLNIVGGGTLVARFGGGDFTTAPSVLFDNSALLVGDQAGALHVVDLTSLTRTTNSVAGGTAFKGFVWEDVNDAGPTVGRLYFVTIDGTVWCLPDASATSPCWTRKPVATGTVSQLLPGATSLWVGGSNGLLYQLDLISGVITRTLTVGAGTLSVGPVSTETTDELYVGTTDGTLYKITLTNGSLP